VKASPIIIIMLILLLGIAVVAVVNSTDSKPDVTIDTEKTEISDKSDSDKKDVPETQKRDLTKAEMAELIRDNIKKSSDKNKDSFIDQIEKSRSAIKIDGSKNIEETLNNITDKATYNITYIAISIIVWCQNQSIGLLIVILVFTVSIIILFRKNLKKTKALLYFICFIITIVLFINLFPQLVFNMLIN
jgi:hypothetical protein